MRAATSQPWRGPRARVLKISRSRVPWGSSKTSSPMPSPPSLLQEDRLAPVEAQGEEAVAGVLVARLPKWHSSGREVKRSAGSGHSPLDSLGARRVYAFQI